MPATAAEGDLAQIRERMVADLIESPVDAAYVTKLIDGLDAEGRWKDVDYANQERAGWRTAGHLDRTLALARAWRQQGSAPDGPVLAAAILGLTHWVDKDYRNPNWWHNEIGIPWKMGDLLLVLGDAAPEATRARAITTIMTRAKIGMTGQNTVWLAGNTCRRALLINDGAMLDKGLRTIFAEIKVGTDEGIQPDASFHQHGPQLQWGNYGLGYASDLLKWAGWVAGTDYALSAEQTTILRDYLFKGLAWSVFHGAMDTACIGRQFSAGSQHNKARAVLRSLDAWAAIEPDQADTCAELHASIGPKGPNTLLGNRVFWRSDVAIQRTPNWMATLKLSSKRVMGGELINDENKRGRYLGQGLLSVLQDGEEYENIYPLWDWSRLPGTTTVVGSDPKMPGDNKKNYGPTTFVGGASDGEYAIVGQDYVENFTREVNGKRAWFMTPIGVVCLGTGFSDSKNRVLQTTVEQIFLRGAVQWQTTDGRGSIDAVTDQTLTLRALTHRNRAYVFNEPTACHLSIEDRQAKWSVISPSTNPRPESGQVLTLDIPHTQQPAAYAYTVLPGIADLDLAQTTAARFHIAANTTALQAVTFDDSVVGIVFHAPGSFTTAAGELTVDTACIALLRKDANATWKLHLADPTHAVKVIAVRLGNWEGHVNLPSKGMAGSTVAVALE